MDSQTQAEGTIRVFTFKQGLLSRLAHDLQLTLQRFELELAEGGVRGSFELGSLRVDGAVKDGRLDPGALDAGDRAKIEQSMRADVLHTERAPTAELEARLSGLGGGRFRLAGTLSLAGKRAPLEGELRLGERIEGRFELQPTRWGIAPFRALGGALKLQDRVVVEVELQARSVELLESSALTRGVRWVPA